jgi:hypothetical protein
MKYQPQHDLIDPEVPAPDKALDHVKNDVPETVDDAYVIGEHGNSIREVDLDVSVKANARLNRWAKPAAFGLMALFLVLTVWNLSHFIQGSPAPPKPTPFQSKQALYLGVMKIDAYRRMHGGITPEMLTEAGFSEDGAYAYNRVSPTRYVLSFRNGGSKLEYDSNEPKELFFGSPNDMLTMGGSK